MFNLTVETNSIERIRELLNDANVSSRIGEKSQDGSLTTLKFKTQEELDKAREILT
jgi:hypothetical protein